MNEGNTEIGKFRTGLEEGEMDGEGKEKDITKKEGRGKCTRGVEERTNERNSVRHFRC